jgi:hypothetical protein
MLMMAVVRLEYTASMPGRTDVTERRERLLRLIAESPSLTPLPAGDAVEAFAKQQLADVTAERFDGLIAFLGDSPADRKPEPLDAIAMRALLGEYVAGVRRLRAVTRVSARMLDEAKSAIKRRRRLVHRRDA